ncbi:hypothetical protein BSM4216_2922 [Bacillus smithii]|nr:hypothetical protein BSM4216_2922 [Bacillus smithii]
MSLFQSIFTTLIFKKNVSWLIQDLKSSQMSRFFVLKARIRIGWIPLNPQNLLP